MSIREILYEIGSKYQTTKKTEQFKGNFLVNKIRKSPSLFLEALGDMKDAFLANASAGQGYWADVPWIAIFYPVVTEGASKGYYVVYLFHVTKSIVYLSLNQAATPVFDEFGVNRVSLEALKSRGNLMRERIRNFYREKMIDEIELGTSNSKFPRGYEAGHVLGFEYDINNLPTEEILIENLKHLRNAYVALAFSGSFSNQNDDRFSEAISIKEEKKYKYHRSIERNANVPKLIKNSQDPYCEVCNFNFRKAYGPHGEGYIEAHHCFPLHKLDENVAVIYKRSDFALLCANCHRMLHRTREGISLEELRDIIKTQSE